MLLRFVFSRVGDCTMFAMPNTQNIFFVFVLYFFFDLDRICQNPISCIKKNWVDVVWERFCGILHERIFSNYLFAKIFVSFFLFKKRILFDSREKMICLFI
eukprot:Anaeramoba_flamelloidesc42435_g2_i1.p1 GENE.c42435_g2_i1~~c42435_g2_i1.p1  ORF type:complete len:101 (-),score=16.18 c42435_g2_i1:9-311(-)